MTKRQGTRKMCSLLRGSLYRGSSPYILLLLGWRITIVIQGSSLYRSFLISGFHYKMSPRKCPKFNKCWPFLMGTERRMNQGLNQCQTTKATCQVTVVSPSSQELSTALSSSFHYQMTKYFNNHVSKTLRQAWRRNMLQYCELLLSYLLWKVY